MPYEVSNSTVWYGAVKKFDMKIEELCVVRGAVRAVLRFFHCSTLPCAFYQGKITLEHLLEDMNKFRIMMPKTWRTTCCEAYVQNHRPIKTAERWGRLFGAKSIWWIKLPHTNAINRILPGYSTYRSGVVACGIQDDWLNQAVRQSTTRSNESTVRALREA